MGCECQAMDADKRPLTALAISACLVHGAAVIWRGIRNVPLPPGLEVWVTGLWLLLAIVVVARRRNARALAGALVALAFSRQTSDFCLCFCSLAACGRIQAQAWSKASTSCMLGMPIVLATIFLMPPSPTTPCVCCSA